MQVALRILGILLCLFFIQAAARFGLSRMFTRYALITNSIPAADEAVRISPSDPEAHRARAMVFISQQMPAEAVNSFETATRLRYRDDYLWIELGNTREDFGDTEGALAALDEAVRWAPYYAHTHWQRGNLLLRMGRSGDAFAELRKAAAANPAYTPNLIDLAWGISRGDLKTTEALLENNDDAHRLALFRFLFAAKAFTEAYEVSHPSDRLEPSLLNGGFEEPLVFNDAGFGWIIAPEQKNHLAIDISEKLNGAKSLQISLDGNWTPGTALLSQTFIVKPGKTYRVSFGVKTKDLVTGGPPLLTVIDATNDQLLAKSANFPTGTTPWARLSMEFTTLPASQAAVIRLQRSNCNSSPCPIFGTLWLDEFSIEQTQTVKN